MQMRVTSIVAAKPAGSMMIKGMVEVRFCILHRPKETLNLKTKAKRNAKTFNMVVSKVTHSGRVILIKTSKCMREMKN